MGAGGAGGHPGAGGEPEREVTLRDGFVACLTAGVAAVGAGYLAAFLPGGPPAWAPVPVVAGTAVSLAAAMALGAVSDGGFRRGAALTCLFVLLVVGGGLGALLALPPADPADPRLVLGLPPRAALLLYGVGLLPVLVVPLAYAWSFEAGSRGDDAEDRTR